MREIPPPPAWINTASRLADTAERDYFTLRRLITITKTTGRNPRSILMSSAEWLLYRWTSSQCVNTLTEAENALSNKTDNRFPVLLVSVFAAISPPQFWLHRRFFFCPIPETKKWWVLVSFGATAAGLFWTVNVCWAHPVISRTGAVASSIFFMVLFPMLLKFAESYVWKLNKP